MARPLRAAAHLSTEELERNYRAAHDPVLRSHYQIMWLVARGQSSQQVFAATGYSVAWIREIVRRYNREGAAGLGDRRHDNPGQAGLLNDALCAELSAALQGAAPDAGLWNGTKVNAWLSERLGRAVSINMGVNCLRRLGWRPQRPRPRHQLGDPAAQAAFKK